MDRILRITAFLAVLAGLGGCATAPPVKDTAAQQQAIALQRNPNCLRFTGSRIPQMNGQCELGIGRIYTAEQLQQTGAFTTGDSLRKLIP